MMSSTLSRKLAGIVLGTLLFTGAGSAAPVKTVRNHPVAKSNVMGWSLAQRTYGFRHFDRFASTTVVKRGPRVHPFEVSPTPLDISFKLNGAMMDTAAYMKANRVTGLLVIKDGRILLERYGLGRTAQDRWAAWSVTKSVTSTLVGAAIKDGAIASVDDPVTKYVPELAKGAFKGVSVRNLLMMSSGAGWDEDYESRKSDFFAMVDRPFLEKLKTMKRVAQSGKDFHYSTMDTNLLGLVVSRATRRPLSRYLSEKIWAPYGMEQDARWWSNRGQEVAGANLTMTLRDFGRFGQFILDDAKIDGRSIVPEGWLKQATRPLLPSNWDVGAPSYGYQWWVMNDGSFLALGIFGQTIFIDRAKRLVVVINSSWERADNEMTYLREFPFLAAIRAAVQ